MQTISPSLRIFSGPMLRSITRATAPQVKVAQKVGLIPAKRGQTYSFADACRVTLMMDMYGLGLDINGVRSAAMVILGVQDWDSGENVVIGEFGSTQITFQPAAVTTMVHNTVDQLIADLDTDHEPEDDGEEEAA